MKTSPDRSLGSSRLYYRICGFVLFFVAAAASFSGYYDKYRLLESGTVNPEFKQTFEAMMDGTAPRPFVYRQLLPAIAKTLADAIDKAFPEKIAAWLYHGHNGTPVGERFLESPIFREPQYLLRYCILYAVESLFVWLAVYALYWLGKAAGFSPVSSALGAIGMILIMPLILTGGGYFYDYPELAFMALAALISIRYAWWWLIPLVALATWNKESFLLFLPSLYPLLRQRSSPRASRFGPLLALAVLMSTSAAVYAYLRMKFANNPGGTVEVHLQEQIQSILHPIHGMFSIEKTYGILMPRGIYLLAALLVVATAWRGWPRLPQAFRWHAAIAAAINLPLYFVLCAPGELRDLSMLYATLFLLIVASISDWITSTTSTPQPPLPSVAS